MARYIDADALKSRMLNYYDCVNENSGKSNYRGETLMNYEVADMIEDCIENAPTADVAPRAEVEELIYKLEYLLCHSTGGRLSKHTYDLRTMETVVTDYINESYSEGVEDGYKYGTAEVAGEIFEELEKNMVTFGDVALSTYFRGIGWKHFKELKKKYTGESQ